MIQHVLFDLDGTLIHFDHKYFIQTYIQLLSKKFAHLTDPQSFGHHILNATGHMLHNTDGKKYNADRFWEYVDANLGLPRAAINPIMDDFYQHEFHELRKIVTVPPTRQAVEKLLAQKIPVSLATNPVFPLTAVKARLSWAGLENTPFQHITHYENSHYCKPSLQYYREIIDALHVPPETCLMVGNDVQEDLAASQLGVKTCLLLDALINRNQMEIKADYIGTVSDFNRDLPNLLNL